MLIRSDQAKWLAAVVLLFGLIVVGLTLAAGAQQQGQPRFDHRAAAFDAIQRITSMSQYIDLLEQQLVELRAQNTEMRKNLPPGPKDK